MYDNDEWKRRQTDLKKFSTELEFLRYQFHEGIKALKKAGLTLNEPEDLVGGINNLAQVAVAYRGNFEEANYQLHYLMNNEVRGNTGKGTYRFPNGTELPALNLPHDDYDLAVD